MSNIDDKIRDENFRNFMKMYDEHYGIKSFMSEDNEVVDVYVEKNSESEEHKGIIGFFRRLFNKH